VTTHYSVTRGSIIKTEHGTCSCPVSMQCFTMCFAATMLIANKDYHNQQFKSMK